MNPQPPSSQTLPIAPTQDTGSNPSSQVSLAETAQESGRECTNKLLRERTRRQRVQSVRSASPRSNPLAIQLPAQVLAESHRQSPSQKPSQDKAPLLSQKPLRSTSLADPSRRSHDSIDEETESEETQHYSRPPNRRAKRELSEGLITHNPPAPAIAEGQPINTLYGNPPRRMSLRLGASLNSESRRRVSYIPTRASSWDQGKEQDKRPEPTGGITESDIPEPSGRYPLPPTNPNTRITLGTDHEVTIRVGDDSLKLRNVDEKLQMRVEGIWIPVSDLDVDGSTSTQSKANSNVDLAGRDGER